MTQTLCSLFFLSGSAALLFETLWFRQAGIAFGNSVWASSLVLSSFMAGLALGNGCMAKWGARVRRPVRFYAQLEICIAVFGVALVFVLPKLGGWLAPLFALILDQGWLLNPLRLLLAFALLLIPATAMGATLPVLVKALSLRDPNFGSVLGRLYGWNTLGAVAGALAGEVFLIEWFGVRGTAWVAGACNTVAAGVAFLLARRLQPSGQAMLAHSSEEGWQMALSPRARRVLAAALGAGGILLAFEVVWFRFMHLFVHSGSLAFAVMLAVVLCGIALGGFVAGLWLRHRPEAPRHTAVLSLLAGFVAVALYAAFSVPLRAQPNVLLSNPSTVLLLSAALMFPVALLSGVLFPFMGALLREELSPDTRAAGLLTLANTLGATLGSALAGFVLLPILGMEQSFLLLAGAYAWVAFLVWPPPASESSVLRGVRLATVAAFVLALLMFPSGKLERVYLKRAIDRWDSGPNVEVVAVREGRTETSVYMRKLLGGEPIYYRLLTDGFAMSGTMQFARRYQKLYVYWPVAMHPDPRRALVISFGVGNTAKALVDTRSLERIDVVDISRDILDLSKIIFSDPATHPLHDPRVQVHIEDGRFYLQATPERYDIITGEPPPPKTAGVVNLYTREYFQLIYDRLAEGGITTYWLPVHNTREVDAQAILRAFCDVFADCSLWSGKGLDWMMVGSRGARWPRDEMHFTRQWRDPELAAELRAVGLETPEQIGALFMADSDQLRDLVAGVEPLTDDRPKRLTHPVYTGNNARRVYRAWTDADANRKRFVESRFIAEAWPEALRDRSVPYFEAQRIIESSVAREDVAMSDRMHNVDFLVRETSLITAPLWHLGVSNDELRAIDALVDAGRPTDPWALALARRAVAERDFDAALRFLDRLGEPRNVNVLYFRATALALAGRREDARALESANRDWLPENAEDQAFWQWIGRPAAESH